MIGVIGIKRLVIVLFLLSVTGGLAAADYMYLTPNNQKLERELRSVKGKVSSKRSETLRLTQEFDQIQEQKNRFQNLRDAGFFSDQNRLIASRRMNEVQQFAKVISARYDVQPANIEKSQLAEEAGHVILDSPMTIDIEAVDDIDVYNFMYWVEHAFPGHVSVRSLKLERTGDIDEKKLRRIGSGEPVVFVKAKVGFSWRTMVPKDKVKLEAEAQGNARR